MARIRSLILIGVLGIAMLPGPRVTRAADCDPRLGDALLYIEDSKESHRVWVDYLRLYPDAETPQGDLAWNEENVRRYDVVLEVLLDSCSDLSSIEIPWAETLIPWRSQVTGELLALGETRSGLDRPAVGDGPALQPSLGYRLETRQSGRFSPR